MTERLLLTGAGGFIGHHTLEHVLATTDWHVVCTDSFRHAGKCDRIREVLDGHPEWHGRVEVVAHDLRGPFTIQTARRLGRIDYIIAMASLSHVDDSLSDPVAFTLSNVGIALSVLEYAAKLSYLRALILVSTDEVYGPAETGHREWAPILPSNPYAASKAAQEAIAISYWRAYGVPLIITNTMNVIGERQDPVKYLPKIIRTVLRGERLTIHGKPGNIGSRHYLHARNAADAWVWLLRNVTPARHIFGEPRPDRFNVCGLKQVDNLALAEEVALILGRRLHYDLMDFHTARPGHDPHYALDGAKLAAAGWKAPVGFEESLERTVRWTVAHPHWLEA